MTVDLVLTNLETSSRRGLVSVYSVRVLVSVETVGLKGLRLPDREAGVELGSATCLRDVSVPVKPQDCSVFSIVIFRTT